MKSGVENYGFQGALGSCPLEEIKRPSNIWSPNKISSKSNGTDEGGEIKLHSAKPLGFFQLFRYASCFERFLIATGLIFAVVTGLCLPFFIAIYGEMLTLLVDRHTEGVTSAKSPILGWFNGGRILKNGTYDERSSAFLEDTVAFSIGAFVAFFLQFVLAILAVTCMNYAAIMQVHRIRMMFLKALLSQDMSWHDMHGTDNVATRLADDLEKVQAGIGETLAVVVVLAVSYTVTVIWAFITGWKMTLLVFLCALVILITLAVVAKMQRSLALQDCQSSGAASAVLQEVLSGIRTVLAFGGEKKEIVRYTTKLERTNILGMRRALRLGLGAGFTWLVIFLTRGFGFRYGVYLIVEDRYLNAASREYTPGVLFIVLFGIVTCAMSLGLAAPRFESLNVARGAASAVFEVIERQSKINCFSKDGQRKQEVLGDIEFLNVHTRYPARPEVPVLQGLNLKIPRGQRTAIVGHSGCGKTTVMQLVQRFYDPDQGKVLLDGLDVKCLNVAWLRGQIGVVSQEPQLFNATIQENICFGATNVSEDEVLKAALEAKAHEFISKLPQGYQTMVGDRGALLSGGQKQRIAIARALVRHPAILLLDEATSALDRACEAQVQSALDAASRGRTTLIVAHRLSTVRAADHIVVLSEGRLVEQGTHDELMAAGGHYHALVAADDSNTDSSSSPKIQNIDKIAAERNFHEERKESAISIANEENPIVMASKETYPAALRRILALNAPEWPYMLVGSFSAIVVGVCMPCFIFLMGFFFKVLSSNNLEYVSGKANVYFVALIVLGVLIGLGMFLQSYTLSVAGVRLTNRLRTSAFAAILRQEVAWFDEERNSVGALCSRLSGDAASVQGVAKSSVDIILYCATSLIVAFAVTFVLTWKLTLVCSLAVPITLCSGFLEHVITKRNAVDEKRSLEVATQVAVGAVTQVRTVACLGAEQEVLQRYQLELDLALAAGRRRLPIQGIVYAMKTAVPFMCYALCFWYGGILVVDEDMAYENVMITGDSILLGAWILGQSLAHAPNLLAAKLAASRIFELLDRVPNLEEPADCVDSKSLVGDIKFSDVKFSYPSRPEAKILRGLDLLVRPGQTVALVGGSGCGKSTCIQLLQRFYDPDAGQIRMGDQSIETVPLRQLRRELGIVSQEPVFFDRTIAENIAYGDNERVPEMPEIIAVAKKANVHSFVAALPMGYHTRLGASGTQLSGGQKQRIAIARALLRNPRLLLLDEATSALDSQSEKVVQAALQEARQGRTCITIAHRLATIQNADLICVLDRGRVAETGTHSELMQLGGAYRRLHQELEAA